MIELLFVVFVIGFIMYIIATFIVYDIERYHEKGYSIFKFIREVQAKVICTESLHIIDWWKITFFGKKQNRR